MFHVFLISVDATPVGVVAHSQEGYRFYAIARAYGALEDRLFDSAEDAHSAALVLSGRA